MYRIRDDDSLRFDPDGNGHRLPERYFVVLGDVLDEHLQHERQNPMPADMLPPLEIDIQRVVVANRENRHVMPHEIELLGERNRRFVAHLEDMAVQTGQIAGEFTRPVGIAADEVEQVVERIEQEVGIDLVVEQIVLVGQQLLAGDILPVRSS